MGANDRRQAEVEDKRYRSDGARGKEAEWRGYVNVDLSTDDKEQFETWMATDEPWEFLSEVVTAGCVLSIKVNPNGGGFLASVTQRGLGHVNAGLCVTARAGQAGKALFRAVFIVAKLGLSADWSVSGRVADPDRW